MNLYLPYKNVEKSVISLDDETLRYQILDCSELLYLTNPYKNHPIFYHYSHYPEFIVYFGYLCCREFEYRFGYRHNLSDKFYSKINNYLKDGVFQYPIGFIQFYSRGNKDDKNCIRTVKNVNKLFRQDLIKKWNTSNPKWTNRTCPKFFHKN